MMFRRILAGAEFAVAALLVLSGVDGLTMNPRRRIGGDGIGTGIWMSMAVPFLVSGVVLTLSAYKAWKGGRRWWAWQAALPVLGLTVLVALMIYDIAND